MTAPISGMRARATLAIERAIDANGHQRSRVTALRRQAPLPLRLVEPSTPEPFTGQAVDVARVCLAAGAAGPIGGDDYRLDITVGTGSTRRSSAQPRRGCRGIGCKSRSQRGVVEWRQSSSAVLSGSGKHCGTCPRHHGNC